jgi:hypothetical protein
MAEPLSTSPVSLTPRDASAVVPFLRIGDLVRESRSARDVARAFAELDHELALRLAEAPDDYVALVGRGELWLRTGRAGDAKPLLERAAYQRPPSWEAYQYVGALLRRAETLSAKEFSRGSGAGLPGWGSIRLLGRRLSGARRGARRGSA